MQVWQPILNCHVIRPFDSTLFSLFRSSRIDCPSSEVQQRLGLSFCEAPWQNLSSVGWKPSVKPSRRLACHWSDTYRSFAMWFFQEATAVAPSFSANVISYHETSLLFSAGLWPTSCTSPRFDWSLLWDRHCASYVGSCLSDQRCYLSLLVFSWIERRTCHAGSGIQVLSRK